MTFTWDSSLLATSALQQVRLTIGDTVSTDELLSDELIEFRLGQYSDDVLLASIECVRDILAQFARDIDKNAVGFSTTRSQKTTHYTDLLKELKQRSSSICEAFVGGTSNSEAETLNSDSDYRQVGITIGWGQNDGA